MEENVKSKVKDFPNHDDWALIKFNRVFRLPLIRNLLSLTEPVFYLKETISRCDDFICGEYMVTVVCYHEGNKQIEIPLRLLQLSERQEKELVDNNIVSADYFSSFNKLGG
jgi:hypothetical protein